MIRALPLPLLTLAFLTTWPGCCRIPDAQIENLYADLEVAKTELQRAAQAGELESDDVVVGSCGESGPLFIFRFTGPFTWVYDFYGRSSGALLGREEGQADIPIPLPCSTTRYWPGPVSCESRRVIEVLSGSSYSVGDTRFP